MVSGGIVTLPRRCHNPQVYLQSSIIHLYLLSTTIYHLHLPSTIIYHLYLLSTICIYYLPLSTIFYPAAGGHPAPDRGLLVPDSAPRPAQPARARRHPAAQEQPQEAAAQRRRGDRAQHARGAGHRQARHRQHGGAQGMTAAHRRGCLVFAVYRVDNIYITYLPYSTTTTLGSFLYRGLYGAINMLLSTILQLQLVGKYS